MAPRGPGGRPKNAWNDSRRRKLIRLHSLTLLNKDEIREVLRASDFDPSSSDIQKKLRALLPPDYAKDHKSYRPSSSASIENRLSSIRRCKSGRISKTKRRERPSILSTRSSQLAKNKQLDQFEGPSHAFHSHAFLPDSRPNTHYFTTTSNIMGSELVNTRLLMLDGSSIVPSMERSSCHSLESAARAISTLRSKDTPGKTATSIRSLARQFADKFSESQIKQIHSVLRLSSSNSWRSSLVSFTSITSSNLADAIPVNSKRSSSVTGMEQIPWSDYIADDDIQIPTVSEGRYPKSPSKRMCCATSTTQLNQMVEPRGRLCEFCGLCRIHWYAFAFAGSLFTQKSTVHSALATMRLDGQYHQVDFYNNSPLHCAASKISLDHFSSLSNMIKSGANVHAINTAGETFMHILCRNFHLHQESAESGLAFLGIIKVLKEREFRFSTQDYHGRTFLHNLFLATKTQKINTLLLGNIFVLIQPNIHTVDSSGSNIVQYLDTTTKIHLRSFEELRDLILSTSDKRYPDWDSIFKTGNSSILLQCAELFSRHDSSVNVCHIGSTGDTPLAAILKNWNPNNQVDHDYNALKQAVEKILAAGANIHIRDRNGDTALAIAAFRGLRQVVIILIKAHARVNCRDNEGTSILSRTRQLWMNAKDSGDQKLYAAIWSCALVLIDAGAKFEPTEQEEWMTEAGILSYCEHTGLVL